MHNIRVKWRPVHCIETCTYFLRKRPIDFIYTSSRTRALLYRLADKFVNAFANAFIVLAFLEEDCEEVQPQQQQHLIPQSHTDTRSSPTKAKKAKRMFKATSELHSRFQIQFSFYIITTLPREGFVIRSVRCFYNFSRSTTIEFHTLRHKRKLAAIMYTPSLRKGASGLLQFHHRRRFMAAVRCVPN